MKECWVIEHDNGVPAQHGFSDGYASEQEALEAIEHLKNLGCVVYRYWRAF